MLDEKWNIRPTTERVVSIRVRHIFLFSSTGFIKIQFGGHFIALGQGISKLFLFFFWEEYSSNNLNSNFGIPCSKVWKIFFSNIVVWRIKRRVLEYWTQISNQFSEMSKNVRLTCEKPCFLENFLILQLFYYLCSQFLRFLKNDSIFVFSVLMRVFWTVTRLYYKNIFLKLYYRGFQTLKPEYSRNIRLRKKIKTVLKSPGRGL